MSATEVAEIDRPVHYLSTLAFDESFLDRIRAVSPRLIVRQITANSVDDIPAEVWAEIDVLHTADVFPPAELAPSMRWVQLDTSGADHLAGQPVWSSGAAITTLGGVGPVAMAEYVMFSLLALAHRLPELVKARNRRWWPEPSAAAALFTPAPVRGTTMAVLGYGRIGQEIGRVACAFGIHVIGMTRTGRVAVEPSESTYDGRRVAARPASQNPIMVAPDEPIPEHRADVVVVGTQRLDEVLALADWVVVVLPRTPETIGLLSAHRFARFKSGAVLINVSRGGIVDEAALLDAVRSGRLGAAAVDVFDAEPLAPESAWWTEPGVLVTPHVAGLTPDYGAHVEHIVTENLVRFLSGSRLMNEVDRTRGY